MSQFIDQLAAAVQARRAPVVAGLDPRWENLPIKIRNAAGGDDRAARAAAYSRFCRDVIDVVRELVPAVKPQAAFFEALGPEGMAALREVVLAARQAGLLVLMDAKRNDIGSTAMAYAEAFFGPEAPWPSDALTVSPYLGADSLEPFVQRSGEHDAGLFVLVKTSNPGGGLFQDRLIDGLPLYRRVGEFVDSLASETRGTCGYGAVGAVAGATYPQQLGELRAAMPNTWFLIPGYGSQGGGGRDVAPGFDARGLGAIVNNSRGLIFAYENRRYERFGQDAWQDAVAAAARDMIAELQADTPAGRL